MNLLFLSICIILLRLTRSVEVFNSSEQFLYYAYGSNLLARRIHINNPSAVFYSIAKLRDHRLDFITFSDTWSGSAATIVEDPGTDIWGALWVLDVKDMKHLDTQEGVDDGFYFVKNVTVTTPGGVSLEARTYEQTKVPPKVPSSSIPPERQPSDTYMEVIIYGAFECSMPLHYIRYLFTFPTNNKVAPLTIRQSLGRPFNETVPR